MYLSQLKAACVTDQELHSRRNLLLWGGGRETVLRWNLTKKVLKQI